MVFQDYALFPHMTVRQNMSFGLELKGMGKADIGRRLDELMAFLELGAYADRYPGQLSGGQRQRVALARALAPIRRSCFSTNRSARWTPSCAARCSKELKSIQRRTHKTFFFVTHDQEEALTMSDRIVVMNAGRVEQDGTPEELYFHPASRFVAEFIGETNLLSGEVRGVENGDIVLDWYGRTLRGRAAAAPRGRARRSPPPCGSNACRSVPTDRKTSTRYRAASSARRFSAAARPSTC
jgi:spermidine/putrescine transport system ATP-binding protein